MLFTEGTVMLLSEVLLEKVTEYRTLECFIRGSRRLDLQQIGKG